MHTRMRTIFLAAWLLFACDLTGAVAGSGVTSSKDYDVGGFDSLDVCCGFHVVITGGDSARVVVTAEEQVLPYIQVSSDGSMLRLWIDDDRAGLLIARTLEAQITMPELRGIVLSGGSRLELGEVPPGGGALALEASGGSHADLRGMELDRAQVRLSGASSAALTVAGLLDYDLSGASHLDYSGTPELGDAATSGGSSASGN